MRNRNRKKNQILSLTIILIVICIGGIIFLSSFQLIDRVERSFGPSDPGLGFVRKLQLSFNLSFHKQELLAGKNLISERTIFTIQPDESAYVIANRLEDGGFVEDKIIFIDYLIYKGYDRLINAGEFYLEPGMNILSIAEKIHSSTGDLTTFNILEGWRVEEIAQAMEVYEFQFNSDSLISAVQHPQKSGFTPAGYENYLSLEGFLSPGQYKVDKNMTLDTFLSMTTHNFENMITPKMLKNFKKNGLNLYEAVTLASIVEKEAILPEEGPSIASVFYNRLAIGMKLESDPTVQYAVGWDSKSSSWWKNPLTISDLQTKSNYNTYQVSGLPPNSICNPGKSALHSVAFPESTNYYYFRAACDNSGKHVFSVTYEEHLQNSCQ